MRQTICTIAILAGVCALLSGQKPPKNDAAAEHHSDVEITGHILKPFELPAPDLSQLHVPNGFRIEKFAENVGNARILAVSPDGRVYVTRRDAGDVLMFEVALNGLSAGAPKRVASRSGLHGIAFAKGKVYLATVHEVFSADVRPDGTFGPLDMIIHDLPDAGQHNTRTIQVGPDEMLYISIGSTCNECAEPNPENATILRASLDGTSRSIFASGLRDTIGWGWHLQTGEMWGMDHGIDWLGDDDQPEELNHIEKGKRYGWPYIYADQKLNPHLDPPAGIKNSEWAQSSTPMAFGYTAHAAPMQMAFYSGTQFPAEYQRDAFISMHGSWNRKPSSGYEVLRIRFENGVAKSIEPFVTGFLTPDGEHGRPFGAAVARDGSLLFTDDRNGIIYRVSYNASQVVQASSLLPPRDAMLRQNGVGEKSPLAIAQLKSSTNAQLSITSADFKSGSAIPVRNSSYDQNISPCLQWTKGPEKTQSYVLIVEDPDAKITPLPIVHWLAWNIPANVLDIHEGLETLERLTDPEGMRQGINSMGAPGYRGPKPPANDSAHKYHFELFAIDQQLELPYGANRDQLLRAMQGHVLAQGEIAGSFARPNAPLRP